MSTVANNYVGLLQTFEKIIADKTMDDDTLDCAKGFLMKVEDFEVVFMLYTTRLMWCLTLSSRGLWMFCTARKDLSLFLLMSKRRGQRGLSKLFMPKQQISNQTCKLSPTTGGSQAALQKSVHCHPRHSLRADTLAFFKFGKHALLGISQSREI